MTGDLKVNLNLNYLKTIEYVRKQIDTLRD